MELSAFATAVMVVLAVIFTYLVRMKRELEGNIRRLQDSTTDTHESIRSAISALTAAQRSTQEQVTQQDLRQNMEMERAVTRLQGLPARGGIIRGGITRGGIELSGLRGLQKDPEPERPNEAPTWHERVSDDSSEP